MWKTSYGAKTGAILVFALAATFYSINLDRPENPDELYHVLAARGLLETGEPRIAEGYYWRAFLFTRLVALSFAVFGESLWSARVPSVLAMATVVAVMFLWVRREAGPLAAWIAAGFYAISPFAVSIAQFCRFYALQTLAFTLAGWLLYDFLNGSSRPAVRALQIASIVALFGLAIHLQDTTLIGIAGLATWVAGVLVIRTAYADRPARLIKIGLLTSAGLALIGAVWLAWTTGWLNELWMRYRMTPLFNAPFRDQFWFYHQWYIILYPTLWTLTGPLVLLAYLRAPNLTAMLTTSFAVAFGITSFGGTKNVRYFSYMQPFLFMIWGIAGALLWGGFRDATRRLVDRLVGILVTLGRSARMAARALAAAAILAVVAVNPFWLRTFGLMANVPIGPEVPDADWRRALPVLAPLAAEAAVVVDGEELAPLYYLGRHDILFSPSKFLELPEERRKDFGRDLRTGRPIIASHAALEKVLRCFPSGLFLAPRMHWNRPSSVDAEAIALLEQYASPVALPENSHVFAYVWRHEADEADFEECAALPGFVESRGHDRAPPRPRRGAVVASLKRPPRPKVRSARPRRRSSSPARPP
jgi:4-amino-4-deoxy-L-arabinose transferase-like glycosyltransferase